ncbi:MAG: sigma-54-dependent Fis family transcriptional regulator [Myxococcales bacterium]|nr:sigma-54-dependent Fis family transcriptional regulator [Myxococcales bacterium]
MATVWLVGFQDAAVAAELVSAGHSVSALSLEEAIASQPTPPDVALVHPGDSPLEGLARKVSLQLPATSCVMLLPPAAALQAASVLDAGASDVALEPLAPGTASVLVARMTREQRARARLGYLDENAARGAQLDDIVANSPRMKELLDRISRISRRSALGPPLSVLLTGETGTGKGLLARAIHFNSRRREGPFIEVNCAAIPSTLLEAELFGHEKGAFTDARSARVGLLEAAHRGTLFLDEVTYLSPEAQAKLLTALETRKVRRLGGTSERQVDVQVLAASCHEVRKLVSEGRFRSELFHRLAALWLELPSLRERGEDALLLAEKFLERVASSYRLPPKRLSEGARAAIRTHSWPGNVRELYHAIERAVLAEEGEVVEQAHLSLEAASARAAADRSGIQVSIPAEGVALAEVERAFIERALSMAGGNVTRAAALLRVTRDTLRSRIEKLGIQTAELAR